MYKIIAFGLVDTPPTNGPDIESRNKEAGSKVEAALLDIEGRLGPDAYTATGHDFGGITILAQTDISHELRSRKIHCIVVGEESNGQPASSHIFYVRVVTPSMQKKIDGIITRGWGGVPGRQRYTFLFPEETFYWFTQLKIIWSILANLGVYAEIGIIKEFVPNM